jgi:hypothetical protein
MNTTMSTTPILHAGTRTPAEVVRSTPVQQGPNGVCFASMGEIALPSSELERMVAVVPAAVAAALVSARKAYYFVPLTLTGEPDPASTLVADRYDVALSDRAICHRNLTMGDSQCVFISTRLMDDKFSVAFEFYINVGHAFVDQAGVSAHFSDLAWSQVQKKVRGETSLDAYENRKLATATDSQGATVPNERAKNDYFAAVFADAVAMYCLSMYLDVDYYELREREYPLLAPQAMAERLRRVHELFPPNPGFEFNIFYKRRA